MNSRSTEFLSGVRDELPILLGVAPFGLIYGVLALSAGLPPAIAFAMSSIVFAGSAQFLGAQLIGAGTPFAVILLSTFVINLRHMLYSASVAPYVKHLSPLWKILLAYLLTDEAYAVTITHYRQMGDSPERNAHWYFLGAGLTLWSGWQISTLIGIIVGAQVPPAWSLDFALALTFIALVVPALHTRADIASAVSAGVVALAGMNLPFKLGLVLAALVGVTVGVLVARRTEGPETEEMVLEGDSE